ncbi:MAG: FAD-dependent monooxygenase, partial [Pseudomonadota bacterium]
RLRKAAGIGVRRWGFGQKALVFAVSHPLPHNNVSTEIHRTGGPFTLVPLPDRAGVPHSAVVWMERGPVAGRLHALDDAAFEEELNARSCGVLGPLRLAGKRAVWPIVNLLAHRFDGPRLALVAEAAHVMPPIGAQGLNTSLGDLRALTALTRGAADPGAAGILSRYHRTRYAPVAARMAGVDLLNRAALAGPQPLRDLRNAGLRLLDATPLRRVAMQVGLGAPLGPVSGKP